MPRQGISFCYPSLPDQNGLVSGIFFPTAVWTLDRQDTTVLGSMCNDYERKLPRIRMEFSFLGHADHRGDPGYNHGLGLNRARSVKDFVDQRLRRFPLYSSVPEALSAGEVGSLQPLVLPGGASLLPTSDQLAFDRRVEVFNSFLGEGKPPAPPPPFSTPPRVRRVTFRRFVDRRHEGATGDTDALRAAERELIFGLVDGTIFRDRFVSEPPGEEVGSGRPYEIPATHRANRVVIVVRDRHEVILGGEIFTTTTTVTYHWGPPARHVIVEVHMRTTDFHGETTTHEPESRVVPRDDGNPFLFPTAPR
jgi:hypothetical protein